MRHACQDCGFEQDVPVEGDLSAQCCNCDNYLFSEKTTDGEMFSLETGFEESGSSRPTASGVKRALPQRIGKFRILSLVGAGGFGQVYKGFDAMLNQHVAIKVPKTNELNEKQIDDFVEEARTMATLEHPNIVPVREVGKTEDGLVYIVMKWIGGQTIAQYSYSNNPSPNEKAAMISQIAMALHFMHKRGYTHRDLKPSNILVDDEGKPSILDFGLALHESKQISSRDQIAGTVTYMSPEQIRGESHLLDGRSDIWSLGAIFYELLSNRRAFLGNDKKAVFEQILKREVKPLQQIDDEIDIRFDHICQKCLEKNPQRRFGSGKELAAAINMIALDSQNSLASLSGFVGGKAHKNLLTPLVAVGITAVVLAAVAISMASGWFTGAGGNSDRGSNTDVGDNDDSEELGKIKHLFWSDSSNESFSKDGATFFTRRKSVVQLGNLSRENHSLKMNLSQTNWTGNFGIIFGFSEDGHQQLWFARHPRTQDQISVSLEYGQFDSERGILPVKNMVQAIPIGTLHLAKQEIHVELHFENSNFVGGTINDVDVHPLTQSLVRATPYGGFGLNISGTDVTISNLTVDGEAVDIKPE